eukprot:Filipodium_phascolosomae@DN2532_c0_g1_i1.p1
MVKDAIKGCRICIQSMLGKYSCHRPKGEVVRASEFNELVSLDLKGPVNQSGGYLHYLVMVDSFSGWVEAEPLRDKHSAQVASKFFNNWIMAVNFRETFRNLDRNGIVHFRTAPYSPWSDGVAERIIHTISQALEIKFAEVLRCIRILPACRKEKSPVEILLTQCHRTHHWSMSGRTQTK